MISCVFVFFKQPHFEWEESRKVQLLLKIVQDGSSVTQVHRISPPVVPDVDHGRRT